MTPWYFHPVLAQIGPFTLHWYGLMYALAFLLSYFYLHSSKHGKSLSLTADQKDMFLLWVIIAILVGGRFGYILFYNLTYYLQNPLKILAVWEGGMSFHGGLLAVIIAIAVFQKKHKIHFFELTDLVTAIAPLGILLGRIGNFVNGELFGRIASQWCLHFPADPLNCRYPSQLFEAFFEGIVLFILLFFIRKKNPKPGVTSCAFLILYGVFRIGVEFFREPDPQIGFLPGGFTEGQLLSFFMILTGIAVWSLFIAKSQTPQKK